MRAREGQELKNASRLVESIPLGTGGRTSMVVDWICRKGVDFIGSLPNINGFSYSVTMAKSKLDKVINTTC
jgi:hypothetical protein